MRIGAILSDYNRTLYSDSSLRSQDNNSLVVEFLTNWRQYFGIT